ncbi:MAG: HAD-IA family hydrolase [Pseudomonadota bacterium]|nr:HAD-IA family hydrolase [Pseudomonadota bacterium]
MKCEHTFTGKIVTGTGKAAFFTQLDWVMAQCAEKLGFVPFPGTLNIDISPQGITSIEPSLSSAVVELKSPDPKFCSSRIVPANLEGIPAAVLFPAKETRIHSRNILEILAPVAVHKALGKNDGDLVSVTINNGTDACRKLRSKAGKKLIVEAIMLDLDGTIIDSVKIYHRIVHAVLDKLELPKVCTKQIQKASRDGTFLWEKLFPASMFDDHSQLKDEAWIIAKQLAPEMFNGQVQLLPGAKEILQHISAKGFKIAVVTSTPRQNMHAKLKPLEEAGIIHLLQEILTADDTARKKPAADPLIECSKRLATKTERCVYVGDTQIDIRAGKAAETRTIGVLSGFDNHEMLAEEDPDAIINSLENLPEVILM